MNYNNIDNDKILLKKYKKVLNIKCKNFLNLLINFLFREKNIIYFFILHNFNDNQIKIIYKQINQNINLSKLVNKKQYNLTFIQNFFYIICEKLVFQNCCFDKLYAKIIIILNYYKISLARHNTLINPYTEFNKNFIKHITLGYNNKIYSKRLFDIITSTKNINIDFNTIINIYRDNLFTSAAIRMFFFRYSYTRSNINFYELPQEVFLIISILLSDNKKNINTNNKEFLKSCQSFYQQISLRKISPATPLLANLRTNTNTASCFIMSMGDNLENICRVSTCAAKIAKNGGGIGIDFSKIRCTKSYIKNIIGKSSGVIPYIKVCNALMLGFDQLGKRNGALTASLSIWHYDILKFLNLQTEENYDARFKAFDIFPQIIMHDLFMKKVLKNQTWLLVDPYEINKKYNIKLYNLYKQEFSLEFQKIINDLIFNNNPKQVKIFKIINARKLMNTIINTQIHTGLPYIFFKDTVNEFNPNNKNGIIYCGNLCQESFSNFQTSNFVAENLNNKRKIININKSGLAHTCNLVSINLARFFKNNKFDFISLKQTLYQSVKLLDNCITISLRDNTIPIPESHLHNFLYRTIGIGFMGLHDVLAQLNLEYGDEKSIIFVDKLFEFIAYYVLLSSNILAKKKGSYPLCYNSKWQKGILFNKNLYWFKNNSKIIPIKQWKQLINQIKKFGLRNGQLLAIAPNTSTSILNGVSSSVLPIFNNYIFRDKNQCGSLLIFPYFFANKSKWYKSSKNIPPQKIIKLISVIYKWIDQGISMELLIDINKKNPRLTLLKSIFLAWKKKIKTIYYIRTIQKTSQKEKKIIFLNNNNNNNNNNNKNNCDMCSN